MNDKVKEFLREELIKSDAYMKVKDLPEQIINMSANTLTRRQVREEVSDYRHELACWKIISDEAAWDSFLSRLYTNRLSVRDHDFVKATVLKEEKALRTEIEDLIGEGALTVLDNYRVVIIQDVRRYDLKHDGKTLTLYIDRG